MLSKEPADKKIILDQWKILVDSSNILKSIRFYDSVKSYPNQKMAKEFLKSAKNDLCASRTLYSMKDYPNAIFHLQQSVEKTAKAYALNIGFLGLDELRGIRHDTPEVFLRLLANKGILLSIDMLNQISSVKIDKSKFPEILKIKKEIKKAKTKVEVANLTKEQIQSVLKLCRDIDEGYQKAKKALDQAIIALKPLSGEMLKIIKPQLEKMNLPDVSKVSEKTINDKLDRIKPELLDQSSKFTRIFILSILTYPHAIFTRYPDGEIKPKDYSQGLGIIDEIEGVWKELEDCMLET